MMIMTAPCLLFFFSFSVSALVGCVDLAAPEQAPEISKRFCCTHFVVTVLLLLLFSSVRFFFFVHFAFMLKINKV